MTCYCLYLPAEKMNTPLDFVFLTFSLPPSTFGSICRLRSPSRNHHRLSGGSDLSLNMAADIWQGQRTGGKEDSGATPSDGVLPSGGGGYVGSLGKVQRVSKKLFKRSELAMIGQPEGNAPGFAACHFKVTSWSRAGCLCCCSCCLGANLSCLCMTSRWFLTFRIMLVWLMWSPFAFTTKSSRFALRSLPLPFCSITIGKIGRLRAR